MFLTRTLHSCAGLIKHIANPSPTGFEVATMVKATCSTYSITENLALNTRRPLSSPPKKNVVSKLDLNQSRPTVVLLEYMNAKKKHVKKIADVYMDWGFDVLQICLKPYQLLFPVKGSQVVAKDLADFLLVNQSLSPLIIHGFSVGGYLWGEALVWFQKDLQTYQPVVDRIKAQIFDSPADFEAIPTAFPSSVFPNNTLFRATFQKYLSFHLKVCYNISTKHYLKSREMFMSGLVKAPRLLIISNADILSTPESAHKARDEILKKNLDCNIKVFDGSQHVMHFKSFPDEYVSEVRAFLSSVPDIMPVTLKSKL